MRKIKSFIGLLVALLILSSVSFFQSDANAQRLLTRSDSLIAGDTISLINPAGAYEKGAFTLTSIAIGDTLKPQARYGNSTQWVTTSVKNIRTQSSDTSITITASSWPVDFEINDPCVVGFRLVSLGPTYKPTRKTYVNFRFRRGE